MSVPSTEAADDWCVRLDAVEKSFGRTRAVAGLSLAARRGAVTAVLGPNGAGKTTTVEICEGLQRPDSGSVRVLGLDPQRDGGGLRPRVGVMVQDGGLPVMARALEVLRHVSRMYAEPRDVDELADTLGLWAFAATSVRRLSGGQRQRLALAIALVGRPELVFLDEPSAGLDPQARLVVWDLVRELRAEGVSVVLTTHLMDEAAQLADHVVVIDHGAVLAQGTVAELTALPSGAHEGEATAARLRGRLTPDAVGELQRVADEHDLRLDVELARERTLEDVFLDLTGRSLR